VKLFTPTPRNSTTATGTKNETASKNKNRKLLLSNTEKNRLLTIDPTITQPTSDGMLPASTENNDSADKISNSSVTDAKLARSAAATLDDADEQHAASNDDETISKAPSSAGPKKEETSILMEDKTTPISKKKSAPTTPKVNAMMKSTLSSPTAEAMKKLMSPTNKGAPAAPETIKQVENELKGTDFEVITKEIMKEMSIKINIKRGGTKQDMFDRLNSYLQLVNDQEHKDRKDVKVTVSCDGASQHVATDAATAAVAPRSRKKKAKKSSEERPTKRKKSSIGATAIVTNDTGVKNADATLV